MSALVQMPPLSTRKKLQTTQHNVVTKYLNPVTFQASSEDYDTHKATDSLSAVSYMHVYYNISRCWLHCKLLHAQHNRYI